MVHQAKTLRPDREGTTIDVFILHLEKNERMRGERES